MTGTTLRPGEGGVSGGPVGPDLAPLARRPAGEAPATDPHRGPAGRPVGRARRLARLGARHRRALGERGHLVEAWLIDLDGRWWSLPGSADRGSTGTGRVR